MTPKRRLIDLGLRISVLSAAFIIPLVFYLDAYEVFELAKSTALKVFGMSAALLLLARGEPIRARSLTASLLFLAMALVSMLKTPLIAASLERIWELASIVALLWAAESGAVSRGSLVSAMCGSYALVTFYGLMQYLGVDWIQWTSFGEKRVYATMGNPDFLAAQSSFLIPIQIALLLATWRRGVAAPALLTACLILDLPSLFYTQARGAYLGFIAALLTLAWLVHRFILRLSVRQFLSWFAMAGGILAVLVAVLPTGRHFIERFAELRDPVKSSSIQIRLFYWYSGFLMGRAHPLTGSGIGGFHLAGSGAQGEAQNIWDRMYPRAAEVVSPHLELYAHNDYVHLFAELGPVGLGVFVWIMVSIIFLGLSAIGRIPPEKWLDRWLAIGLLASAVSYYVNSAMNFPLKVVPNAHFFFSCVVALLLPLTAAKPQILPLPRQKAAVIAALLAVFILSERAMGKMLATSYLKIGHRTLQANRVSDALRNFDCSNRLRPVHTDAILVNYYGGKALQSGGDYRGAVNAFTRSIASFPDFPEGYQARGLARMAVATETLKKASVESATNLEQAVVDLRRSAWLNPKEPQTWFFLGSALRMQAKPGESVSPFIECIRFSQGRIPDAYYGLALSLIETRRPADARKALEELLAKVPNFPGARKLLSGIRR